MSSSGDDEEDDIDEQDLQDDPIWNLDLYVRPATPFASTHRS